MKKILILFILFCFILPFVVAQQNSMVRIQSGTFTMGSPESEPNRHIKEIQRQVTISAFSMSKYEITQKEYREIMGENPSVFKGDNLPVENLTWLKAVEYCNRRSYKEGLTLAYRINGNNVTWNREATGYRLPTEAEWEYACRAGTTTAYNTGDNISTDQANFNGVVRKWQEEVVNEIGIVTRIDKQDGLYREKTMPVGSFKPNAWGLYDMHGNVRELCWDWDGDYAPGVQTNPSGAVTGNVRVVRGGGWDDSEQLLRSARRRWAFLDSWTDRIGFRVVLP